MCLNKKKIPENIFKLLDINMKKFTSSSIFISFLLSFFFVIESFSQEIEDWEIYKTASELGSSGSFNSINKFDDNHLMVSTYISYGFVDFLVSSDAGQNWTKTYSSDSGNHIVSINCLANGYCYILEDSVIFCGYDQYYNMLNTYLCHVLKSTDYGNTWQKIIISDKWRTRPSAAMNMSDENNGIIIQYPDSSEVSDIIWNSNNGWNSLNKINKLNDLGGVEILRQTKDNKIIVKAYSFNAKKTQLYILSNNDSSPIIRDFLLPVKYQKFKSTLNIPYDSLMYSIGYQNETSFIVKSTNNGLTWLTVLEDYNNRQLWKLMYIDRNVMIIWGDSIYRSFDEFKTHSSFKLYAGGGSFWGDIIHLSNNIEYAISGGALYRYFGSTTLAPPIIISPKDSIWYQPLNFTIKWNPIIGAYKYQLMIDESYGVTPGYPNPYISFDSTLFVNDSSITETSYTLQGTSNYRFYAVMIRAINSNQKSPWLLYEFQTKEAQNDVIKVGLINNQITISPNPAFNDCIIKINHFEPCLLKIVLLDIFGQSVLPAITEFADAGTLSKNLDLSGIAPGVYFVVINTGKERYVQKFVKTE
jgi:hypothetical protein